MHTITAADLLCPCCDTGNPDPRLIAGLNHLQQLLHTDLAIRSACRCPKHNTEVGGAVSSQHLTGRAADVYAPGRSSLELYLAADHIPIFRDGGIGLYPGEFIHLDTRLSRSRWFRIQGQDRPITDYLSQA